MSAFLLIIIALVAILLLGRILVNVNPGVLARGLKVSFGLLTMAIAAAFAITGRWVFAIPTGMLGFALLTGRGVFPGGGYRAQPSPGRQSTVRTRLVEMQLDHDSGDIEGRVLSGPFADRMLSELDLDDLIDLYQSADAQTQALLNAYLDRRFPGWRERVDPDAATGAGEVPPAEGPMTEQQAEEILGLGSGASADDIRDAHRRLMKQFHPDRGGSTYFAAKINEAKDVLLRRHGGRS